MTKLKKALMSIVALCAVFVCCLAITACGGGTTYKISYNKLADFATDTYHSGYIAAVMGENATYDISLTVSGSDYTLVKEMTADPNAKNGDNNMNFHFKFEFSGKCEADGDNVTLKAPTKCVWQEDWAGLDEYGAFTTGKGTATSSADVTENGDVVFNLFNGEWLNLSSCADQTVTLKGSTFSFND